MGDTPKPLIAAKRRGSTKVVLCANCGERPGTEKWSSDETSFARGWFVMWCEVCCLREQIKHAEERAAELPKLRARFDELTATAAKGRPKSSGPGRRAHTGERR